MRKDAIESLIKRGEAEQINNTLPEAVIALPIDYGLKDIEQYMPIRQRYRTKISTHSIEDFASESNSKPCRCFVNENDLSASSIFNLGTDEEPGHGDHRITLKMRQTAEFQEILSATQNNLSQQAAAEWLEDWIDFLSPVWTQEDVTGSMQQAIQVIRNMVIDASIKSERGVSDFGAEKSDIEKIEARGRDLPIPGFFIFKCAPYRDLRERDIALRLSMVTGDKPMFRFRIVRRDMLDQEITQEFTDLLRAQLHQDVGVTIGTIEL